MNRKSVFFSIVALAWPTILEQAMQTAVSYIDYAMVGKVGTAAIAAVGVTGTVTWLVNSPLWAFATGFLACIAQDSGAGDTEHARRTAAQAVTVSVAVGALMTLIFVGLSPVIPRWMGAEPEICRDAAWYFGIVSAPLVFRALMIVLGGVIRGVGDTRTPMLVNVGVNLINIVFNFLLIYPTRQVRIFGHAFTMWGANLGVPGAAIATAIAFVFGGVAMVAVLLRHKGISPRGCAFRPDAAILKPCMRITVPNVLQRTIVCLGQVTFSSMVNSLGTVAVTAHSTAITAESAFYIPGFGVQAAAAALVGNAYGAKDKKRMRELTRMLLMIVFFLMVITGTALFFCADEVMGLFTDDARVIDLGAKVLKMVAVSEPIYGVAIILEGIFHGVGDTLSPFIFEAACMWGVRIVGTFVTVKCLHGDLSAAWASMIAHNVVLALMLTIHYFRGKWNPLNRETTTGE